MALKEVKHPTSGNQKNEVSQTLSDTELAPLIAIGGLLTIKRVAFWYEKLLSKDKTSPVRPNQRFIAPPKRGIAKPEIIRTELSEKLMELHERLGYKKMFLVGHSLGGLLATAVALEQPELVSGVVSLGGVHAGHSGNLVTSGLEKLLGSPNEAEYIKPDSKFIREHVDNMAHGWPLGVSLHVIGTPLDALVTPPQGFGLELAHGQPEERLLEPPLMARAIRRALHIPDQVKALPTPLLPEHIYLPRNPAVINYVAAVRPAAEVSPINMPLAA